MLSVHLLTSGNLIGEIARVLSMCAKRFSTHGYIVLFVDGPAAKCGGNICLSHSMLDVA